MKTILVFKNLIAGYCSKVTSDCLLIICILCLGCNHSKLQNHLEANHIKTVTGKEDMALQSVIGFADKHLSVIRTKGGTDKNLEIISTLDKEISATELCRTFSMIIKEIDEALENGEGMLLM